MIATTLPRRAIALLLIAAAALFVLGVRAEGDEDTHSDEPRGETAESTEGEEVTEAAGGEAEAHEEGEAREQQEAAEGEEATVLGLDLESPPLVGAAVVVSILLAGLALARRDRLLLLGIAVFAGAFAVLDIAEMAHQLDEDNTGLAVLAAVIAVLHVGAALLAFQQASSATPTNPEHEPAPT